MTKIVNAERASYKSPKFATMQVQFRYINIFLYLSPMSFILFQRIMLHVVM